MKDFHSILFNSDLKTYDPYDIWKTRFGLYVKQNYYSSPKLFLLPAMGLSFFDLYLNNKFRIFYSKQEYPIVRALAAISSILLYQNERNESYLNKAEEHVNWLLENKIRTPNGIGWGIGFTWPAGKNLVYSDSAPLSTHTPYILEAVFLLSKYRNLDFDLFYKEVFAFFEKDLKILYEDENSMAISYGSFNDRIATNATSYALFSYSIFYQVLPDIRDYIEKKARKFYNFIIENQGTEGEWLYIAKDKNSFIDCFHTCFILENIAKSKHSFSSFIKDEPLQKGWRYLKLNMYDEESGLFKRFTKRNKAGAIKFDLYDNAEALTTSYLLNDEEMTESLNIAIKKNFIKNNDLYSGITYTGKKVNKNMLRWAVMPYIHALTIQNSRDVRHSSFN